MSESVPLLEPLATAQPSATDPQWLQARRQEAALRVKKSGLPTSRTEAWRFTPLRPLTNTSFASVEPDSNQPDAFNELSASKRLENAHNIVVVHGAPTSGLEGLPEGVEALSIAELLSSRSEKLEPYLDAVAYPEDFSALNSVLFRDGIAIFVAPHAQVQQPIHLIHVQHAGQRPQVSYGRTVLVLGSRSEASVIESFEAAGEATTLHNVVTEVDLAAGARLRHDRMVRSQPPHLHLGKLAVRQGRDSHYASRVLTLGGALSRLDLRVELRGAGAECDLVGTYVAAGDEHVDHHTTVNHVMGQATSGQSYRGIVSGRGKAVFDGTVLVQPDAQQSAAHQVNRNLLLSDEAVVHTKPHLEIEADDVTCSHGATIGSLDEDQLFYFQSRGIDAREVRSMLTEAFVRAQLEDVAEAARPRWQEQLRERVQQLTQPIGAQSKEAS